MGYHAECPSCGTTFEIDPYANTVKQVVEAYLGERTRPKLAGRVLSQSLISDYMEWSSAKGHGEISTHLLGATLQKCGVERYKSNGKRYYLNLELVD